MPGTIYATFVEEFFFRFFRHDEYQLDRQRGDERDERRLERGREPRGDVPHTVLQTRQFRCGLEQSTELSDRRREPQDRTDEPKNRNGPNESL